MRLGTLSERQAGSGLGITGPLPPVPAPGNTEIVGSTITYGGPVCLDNNGQYTSDPSQCYDGAVYQAADGSNCFRGYGPPPAGQVYCATACGTGEAWDPISQSCKTLAVAGSGQWLPGISNNILLAGAALIAVLAFTGGRR